MASNPITMVGHLDYCWLFTYQTKINEVENLLPANLSLVTYKGYAFWNVVVSHIKSMRPKHIPAIFGLGYWHIAYRLYVKFQPKGQAAIEGLYFLRSDCDSRLIALGGNMLTNFNLHLTDIEIEHNAETVSINIKSLDAPAKVLLEPNVKAQLPENSIFPSLEVAGDFLKYKPNGIAINTDGNANIIHIKRREEDWRYQLINVKSADWAFFKDKNVSPVVCYQVEPIDYQWNRGRNYQVDQAPTNT